MVATGHPLTKIRAHRALYMDCRHYLAPLFQLFNGAECQIRESHLDPAEPFAALSPRQLGRM
jgi:hypothetical protein